MVIQLSAYSSTVQCLFQFTTIFFPGIHLINDHCLRLNPKWSHYFTSNICKTVSLCEHCMAEVNKLLISFMTSEIAISHYTKSQKHSVCFHINISTHQSKIIAGFIPKQRLKRIFPSHLNNTTNQVLLMKPICLSTLSCWTSLML